MTGDAVVVAIVQALTVVALAPLLLGVIRTVKATLEGRRGGGVWQPWRDLAKMFRRAPQRIPTGGQLLWLGPVIGAAAALTLCLLIPLTSRATIVPGDLFVVVSVMAVGAIVPALVGLAGGTAFGGMGASRHLTVLALVEPTLLLAIYAISTPARSSDLSEILDVRLEHPAVIVSPVGLLALAALVIAVIAEGSRLPVDNPSTHLELTMIHEAMVLESSGRDLAWLDLAASLKLVALLGLLANLALPWGVATAAGPALIVGVVSLVVKVLVLGALLAVAEVGMAKLRLFRVPELLAGSMVLAFLAVAMSAVVPA
ncbi:respiratory chain complex I subunit 1 family protein [Gordonia sp. NPDC003424]